MNYVESLARRDEGIGNSVALMSRRDDLMKRIRVPAALRVGHRIPLVKCPRVVPLPESGLCVFESRHASGFYGELCDPFSKFLLIIAGKASWESGGRRFPVGPGDLVHIPAGVGHRQRDIADHPVTLYALQYRPGLLGDLGPCLAATTIWRLANEDDALLASRVESSFQELMFEQSQQRLGWTLAMQAAFSALAVSVVRRQSSAQGPGPVSRQSRSEKRIVAYAQRLETSFYRQQTLDDAALATGLSRRQFTALFRKVTGESWRDHIEQLRLKHAQRLLLETDSSILAVAFECGFENAASFYRAFKKRFGDSPGNWKAKAQRAGRPNCESISPNL